MRATVGLELGSLLLLLAGSALAEDNVPVQYAPVKLSVVLEGLDARPTTLAAGDFDGDGVADLVSGYATTHGGLVVLFSGNPDATHFAGQGAAPFLNGPLVLAIDVQPQRLEPGYFDDDTFLDLIVYGEEDEALALLSGRKEHALDRTETPSSEPWLTVKSLRKGDFSETRTVAIGSTDQVDNVLNPDRKNSETDSRNHSPPNLVDAFEGSLAVVAMRLNGDALDDFVVLRRDSIEPVAFLTQTANIFIVNSPGDAPDCDPQDSVCSTGRFDLETNQCILDFVCTLRAAIEQANASIGADAVSFIENLPRIDASFLPGITDPLIIDGNGQVELRGTGIFVGGRGHVVIRGMTINGSLSDAIYLTGAGGNIIEGNRIGTDVSGTMRIGNLGQGVRIESPNNLIGGTTSRARNLISGNDSGIQVSADENVIVGNYIGTDAGGTRVLGNGFGIQVGGGHPRDNVIGGSSAAEGNLIAGNRIAGIFLNFGSHTRVEGNLIGAGLGNGESGVFVRSNLNVLTHNTIDHSTQGVRIEGSESAVSDNVISDNHGSGLSIGREGELNEISRNTIVQNGGGIQIQGSQNFFMDNIIRENHGDGVRVLEGLENRISQNSIARNGGLGIRLYPGLVPTDPGDADTGPNEFQNAPDFRWVANSATIQGELQSTPASSFTIELFGNATCDPSGHGEGETFLGSTVVRTDASGAAHFSVAALAAGGLLTGTATDASGNSSEFSRCIGASSCNCDDGIFCNGKETCDSAGNCLPGTPESCFDGDPCSTDICDRIDDTCKNIPIPECPPDSPDLPDFPPPIRIRVPDSGPIIPPSAPPIVIPLGLPVAVNFSGGTSGGILYGSLLLIPRSGASSVGGVWWRPISALSEAALFSFNPSADPTPFWQLTFDGSFTPPVHLEFTYDVRALRPGVDESLLTILQWIGGSWVELDTEVDRSVNLISTTTDSLSVFALGLRGEPTCTETATTLCLDDRFRVSARWETVGGDSGDGQARPLTGDTGTYWFFDPANLEVIVKVINGCVVNGRIWVFAAGLTDTGVELTVEDTRFPGQSRTYSNPIGTPFKPIQDTSAFSECDGSSGP